MFAGLFWCGQTVGICVSSHDRVSVIAANEHSDSAIDSNEEPIVCMLAESQCLPRHQRLIGFGATVNGLSR